MADFAWMDIKNGDRQFTSFMWGRLAHDVVEEFRYEGIPDAAAFHEDVMRADHREAFWRRGLWFGSIWSGWACEGVRTFGAVVRRPEELPWKIWVARRSRAVLDSFVSREPDGAESFEVLMPPFVTRCMKHAIRFCGLVHDGEWTDRRTGREYFVMKYERRAGT